MTTPDFLIPLFPEVLLGFLMLVVFVLDLGIKKTTGKNVAWLVLASLLTVVVFSFFWSGEVNGNLLTVDRLSIFARLLVLVCGFLGVLISYRFFADRGGLYTEIFHVIQVLTLGALLLVQSSHFLLFFLGLETVSICSYILCASRRGHATSVEAALKYFILGAVASAFMAYGIALIYGAAGSLDFFQIRESLEDRGGESLLARTGLVLLLAGIAFKLALFPFHLWSPDVYEGVAVPYTAIFATLVKVAVFVALFRMLKYAFPALQDTWRPVLVFLSAFSMLYGNFAALGQKNLKRLMAYSSIAHSGYLVVAVLSLTGKGEAALAYYFIGYVIMSFGFFGSMVLLGREREILTIEDLNGLGNRNKLLGFGLSLILIGFAGFPLTAGFIGKLYVFYSGMETGYLTLVSIGILSGIFSIFYYFRIIQSIFRHPFSTNQGTVTPPLGFSSLKVCVFLSVLLTLLIGIFPSFFLDLVY